MNESELLVRLSQGDEEAFDALFRQFYPAVVRSAVRIVRETAIAEELAQDVFLAMWRRRDSLNLSASPQSYLFQAVRNRALNFLRNSAVAKRNAEVIQPTNESPEMADDNATVHDLQSAFRAAVASLPPRCKEVFEMSRDRGLRYSEIADILGISVKAVEANMGRALKSLREKLSPWLDNSSHNS